MPAFVSSAPACRTFGSVERCGSRTLGSVERCGRGGAAVRPTCLLVIRRHLRVAPGPLAEGEGLAAQRVTSVVGSRKKVSTFCRRRDTPRVSTRFSSSASPPPSSPPSSRTSPNQAWRANWQRSTSITPSRARRSGYQYSWLGPTRMTTTGPLRCASCLILQQEPFIIRQMTLQLFIHTAVDPGVAQRCTSQRCS